MSTYNGSIDLYDKIQLSCHGNTGFSIHLLTQERAKFVRFFNGDCLTMGHCFLMKLHIWTDLVSIDMDMKIQLCRSTGSM